MRWDIGDGSGLHPRLVIGRLPPAARAQLALPDLDGDGPDDLLLGHGAGWDVSTLRDNGWRRFSPGR